jgi:thiosulfate reductase cytochrome b subunit
MNDPLRNFSRFPRWFGALLVLMVALGAVSGLAKAAGDPVPTPAPAASPLHPTFPLLDADGANVLESGNPFSTMRTCGACHDTAYIEQHSFHADLGLSDFGAEDLVLAQPWDQSRGLFGKWDPLTYRYLSPAGAERIDLTTPEWLRLMGARVPGGGPATTARDGTPLTELPVEAASLETSVTDPVMGESIAWDWKASGTLEMDCFLCHAVEPNSAARGEEIAAGAFGWANTATLVGSGIVTKTAEGYAWQPEAFDESGELKPAFVRVQDPSNENCAQCHGVVHVGSDEPLMLDACDTSELQTATTGQVIASQKIAESAINLQDKNSLSRSWDIHAERGLKCTDCHYALNNPVHAQEAAGAMLSHLAYDPRKLEIGEYLRNPNHNLARGESAQFTIEPELKGSMRRCESCHKAEETHGDWLPYSERHMEVVACESCHIPTLYAPALSSVDWTVLGADQGAVTECRGMEGTDTITGLVTGFQPVLMQRRNVDGDTQLSPYNLISAWYWVYEDSQGATYPVPLADLKAAYFDGDGYASEVVQAFDADGDGILGAAELKIDTPEKQALMAQRLQNLGLQNPRIEGQVQPYSINHNVARGDWTTRACEDCHSDDSTVTAPILLASNPPGGITPTFVRNNNVSATGNIVAQDGTLFYQPVAENDGIYIFGRNRVSWVDWFGAVAFVGTLLAVASHAGMRFYTSLRHPQHTPKTKRVYMYSAYERFWHWLQTVTIVLLLFTGLVIHRPDMFGVFSFPHMVTMHNVLAVILVVNAGLSLFWHLTGGQIQQYIPRPYGFFDQAIEQAKFYMWGIFYGAPHPFAKTRRRHLNPLQQVTYFGILNVLLPLQIITGALMWGVQQWPQIAGMAGGLPVLAPLHSLVAWLFATFIVAHVYLTTTGHEPTAGIKAMVTGWDDIEIAPGHGAADQAKQRPGSLPQPMHPTTLTEASE